MGQFTFSLKIKTPRGLALELYWVGIAWLVLIVLTILWPNFKATANEEHKAAHPEKHSEPAAAAHPEKHGGAEKGGHAVVHAKENAAPAATEEHAIAAASDGHGEAKAAPVAVKKVEEEPICAVIESVRGGVEILPEKKDRFIKAQAQQGIPCRGWVSVEDGYVDLQHKQGFVVRIGAHSGAQVFDLDENGRSSFTDHLVLFRGYLLIKNGESARSVRVLTPNSRAWVTQGSAVVSFSTEEDETQLIALQSSHRLENRHLPLTPVQVRPGEMTFLNLKLVRNVPEMASAVNSDSFSQQLSELGIIGDERSGYLDTIRQRQDRKFPVLLGRSKNKKDSKEEGPKVRAPASAVKTYPAIDASQVDELVLKRLVGGEKEGLNLVYVNKPKEELAATEASPSPSPIADAGSETKSPLSGDVK